MSGQYIFHNIYGLLKQVEHEGAKILMIFRDHPPRHFQQIHISTKLHPLTLEGAPCRYKTPLEV